MTKRIIKLLPFLAMCMLSCEEPFFPDIPNSEKSFYVVDGVITDQPGPYFVTISKSTDLNSDNAFVSGANVFIEDQNGLTEKLQETESGVYRTNNLQGAAGNEYRLRVEVNSQEIESSWETLTNSASLDSIYYKPETKATSDKDANEIGLQFYADSHGTLNDPRHYRFEWDETWRVGVSWPISYDYIGNDMVANTTSNLNIVCWKNEIFSTINLASTTDLTENTLSGHKLDFIKKRDDKFTKRYSIEVKQYWLSQKEYIFWKTLKDSNLGLGGSLGNLFSRQPEKVFGNLTNISDPSTPVLGYFSASGVQSQRIFIDPQEIPSELSRQIKCPLDTISKFPIPSEYNLNLFLKLRDGAFFYDFVLSNTTSEPIAALLSTLECSDCVEAGGNPVKPEFWDE